MGVTSGGILWKRRRGEVESSNREGRRRIITRRGDHLHGSRGSSAFVGVRGLGRDFRTFRSPQRSDSPSASNPGIEDPWFSLLSTTRLSPSTTRSTLTSLPASLQPYPPVPTLAIYPQLPPFTRRETIRTRRTRVQRVSLLRSERTSNSSNDPFPRPPLDPDRSPNPPNRTHLPLSPPSISI